MRVEKHHAALQRNGHCVMVGCDQGLPGSGQRGKLTRSRNAVLCAVPDMLGCFDWGQCRGRARARRRHPFAQPRQLADAVRPAALSLAQSGELGFGHVPGVALSEIAQAGRLRAQLRSHKQGYVNFALSPEPAAARIALVYLVAPS